MSDLDPSIDSMTLIERLRYATGPYGAGDGLHRAALAALEDCAAHHQLGITEPKSVVSWEYGISRDQVSARASRKQAEQEIDRQRKGPRGYRITGQKLVRRLVSAWEEVTNDE